ncbi:MAG: elongation factor P [Alphaproteobacteria bacterium GM7ARS4]|nr:elongation factor P [Alphaproteobacteria bacterium GM7ARS4]
MKINAIQIRAGHVLEHQGKRYTVLSNTILQPGKGSAFVQVEMRDIATGTKVNQRWRTQESVERLHVEEHLCQFLYMEGTNITLMDKESYEQYSLSQEMLGKAQRFLQDGMEVAVDFIDGEAVSVRLPPTVTLTVREADPVIKGQTATSSYKSALLDNGVKTMVPPHISVGDGVVINTLDGSYVEKAKS